MMETIPFDYGLEVWTDTRPGAVAKLGCVMVAVEAVQHHCITVMSGDAARLVLACLATEMGVALAVTNSTLEPETPNQAHALNLARVAYAVRQKWVPSSNWFALEEKTLRAAPALTLGSILASGLAAIFRNVARDLHDERWPLLFLPALEEEIRAVGLAGVPALFRHHMLPLSMN